MFAESDDVISVRRRVVGRRCERDQEEEGYDAEKSPEGCAQRTGKRYEQQQHSCQTFRREDPGAFASLHVEQRTPEGFQSPRQSQERSPENRPFQRHAQIEQHDKGNCHGQNIRCSFGKIECGDPCPGTADSPVLSLHDGRASPVLLLISPSGKDRKRMGNHERERFAVHESICHHTILFAFPLFQFPHDFPVPA